MKFFYSVMLLMAIMSVNASEKKLRTKLEREYDLQLAKKQKEIESRKFLESIAKKHKKTNIRNEQQKNIQNNNNTQIKQNKNKQKNINLSDNHVKNMNRINIALVFLFSTCFYPALWMMGSVLDTAPIGCYYSGNVCKCYYM